MTKRENELLFAAIQRNDRAATERLLDEHPDAVNAYGFSNRNCRDKTPLMFAMQCGHLDLAWWLLDKGANVTQRMAGGPGKSTIALAAQFGHPMAPNFREFLDFTPELIRRGANPTDALSTALYFYRDFGEAPERMIRLLIEHDANVNAPNGDLTIRERVENAGDRYPAAVRALFGLSV